jgi:hypothetical protein
MIGVAIVEVAYPGQKPYKHQHTWMSEGREYAPVELADWKTTTEKEQNCTLEILEWHLEERSDIGY